MLKVIRTAKGREIKKEYNINSFFVKPEANSLTKYSVAPAAHNPKAAPFIP